MSPSHGALPASILFLLSVAQATAQVNVAPQALEHYAYCIEQANQDDVIRPGTAIHVTQRETIYRCRDEIAVSYFNDIGRRRIRSTDREVENDTGAYILRPITGVGYCWHKIRDENQAPISFWGCDIHVAF